MATHHILPIDDLYPHEESQDCECNPRVEIVEDSLLIVHYAWDGRDILEELDNQ